MNLDEHPVHRLSEHRSKLSLTISSEKTCWMSQGGARMLEGKEYEEVGEVEGMVQV